MQKYQTESFKDLNDAYNKLESETGLNFDNTIHQNSTSSYDSVEVIITPDNIIVGCLKYDESPQDFWDDEGQGQFIEFRSAEQRDSYLSTLKKSSLFYLVDKYSHGNSHYSISGTNNYPDQRWDVSHGCAVFIPCDFIQDEYKKAKKTMKVLAAKDLFIKDSNSTLDSYSDYCNGEAYGYSIAVYDKKGNIKEENECWGFIGNKNAHEEKTAVMKQHFEDGFINQIYQNVIILNTDINKLKEFNVTDLKDIVSAKISQVYDDTIIGIIYKDNKASVLHFHGNDENPTIGQFSESQLAYGVTKEKFVEARFNSDIKDIIRNKLQEQNNPSKSLTI